MADTVVLDQTINAEPSHPPRKPRTFTAETARKAALASIRARAFKAQLMEAGVTTPSPLSADVQGKPGVVVVSLPREENELTAASDRVRAKLAKALEASVDVLVNEPPTARKEITGRDGTAQGLKTLADGASTLFGWGDTQPGGLIVVGEITAMGEPPQPAQVSDCQTVPAAGQPVIDVALVAEGLTAPEPKPSLGAGPAEAQAEVVPVASEPAASC